LFGLIHHHCVFAEVKHLFTEQLQDVKDILALALAGVGSLTNVRNEVVPADHPFLFDNTNQCGIKFCQQM